jgi:hypothetical protein
MWPYGFHQLNTQTSQGLWLALRGPSIEHPNQPRTLAAPKVPTLNLPVASDAERARAHANIDLLEKRRSDVAALVEKASQRTQLDADYPPDVGTILSWLM